MLKNSKWLSRSLLMRPLPHHWGISSRPFHFGCFSMKIPFFQNKNVIFKFMAYMSCLSLTLFETSQSNMNQGKMAYFSLESGKNIIFYWWKSGKNGHFWNKIRGKIPSSALDTLIWLKAYVYNVFNLWANTESCLDHIGTIFSLILIQTSWSSKIVPAMQWLLFGMMSVQCLNHTGSIFCLTILLNSWSFKIFKTESICSI